MTPSFPDPSGWRRHRATVSPSPDTTRPRGEPRRTAGWRERCWTGGRTATVAEIRWASTTTRLPTRSPGRETRFGAKGATREARRAGTWAVVVDPRGGGGGGPPRGPRRRHHSEPQAAPGGVPRGVARSPRPVNPGGGSPAAHRGAQARPGLRAGGGGAPAPGGQARRAGHDPRGGAGGRRHGVAARGPDREHPPRGPVAARARGGVPGVAGGPGGNPGDRRRATGVLAGPRGEHDPAAVPAGGRPTSAGRGADPGGARPSAPRASRRR